MVEPLWMSATASSADLYSLLPPLLPSGAFFPGAEHSALVVVRVLLEVWGARRAQGNLLG